MIGASPGHGGRFVSYARARGAPRRWWRHCGAGMPLARRRAARHRAYAEVIEERLKSAKAVVVLWSAEAAKSQWVRAEAISPARGNAGPGHVDGTLPPLPFNQIQCADLSSWDGSRCCGLAQARGQRRALAGARRPIAKSRGRRRPRAFASFPSQNMSGDPEQEYFSDGISEDITTDLSKVSALGVVARNTLSPSRASRSTSAKSRASSTSATSSKEASARPAAGSGSTPSSSTAPAGTTSGRNVTTATSTIFSRSRTKFRRRSSGRSN